MTTNEYGFRVASLVDEEEGQREDVPKEAPAFHKPVAVTKDMISER